MSEHKGLQDTHFWAIRRYAIEYWQKKKDSPTRIFLFFVAKLGLEPRQTEPESVVLPLHHLAM